MIGVTMADMLKPHIAAAGLVTTTEAAAIIGISTRTLHRWRHTHDDFPPVVAGVRGRTLFRRRDVERYARSAAAQPVRAA
jgi:predicted site-specific integrase-resolvase